MANDDYYSSALRDFAKRLTCSMILTGSPYGLMPGLIRRLSISILTGTEGSRSPRAGWRC
jgi:hypothetical protein